MRYIRLAACFCWCGAALAGALALPAEGQTLDSYAAAMVRPPLEAQFGFDAPRWLRHDGPFDDSWGWDGYGGPPPPPRPHVAGRVVAPDLIVYHCLDERRPLEVAVAKLRPFGTLKLVGSGPACTLVVPLKIDKPLRISGDKDALLMAPPGAPCLIVAPGNSLAVADVRLRSWSDGGAACVVADGADVSLEHMAVETRGTAVAAHGGRLSLRDVHFSGGPGPVLKLDHAEFAIVKANVESFGDGADIVPPDSGIAQISEAEFDSEGRVGVGLVLHGGGTPGARVVLDSVKLEGFVTGLAASQGARAVATHLHVGHAGEVGVEVTGAGLDLSNSVVDAGAIGVRLAGYVPGAPGDAPRIQDNEINARGIAGIYVADGTPGEARNNAIGVPPGRCIVGASHAGDFKERANLCHPL
jgi:hypothetical protein